MHRIFFCPAQDQVNMQLTPQTPQAAQNAHCSVGLPDAPSINVSPVVPPTGSGKPPRLASKKKPAMTMSGVVGHEAPEEGGMIEAATLAAQWRSLNCGFHF
jgi:hypothetical protein